MIKQLLDKAPFITHVSIKIWAFGHIDVGGYGQYKFNFPAMNFRVKLGKGNILNILLYIFPLLL